MIEVSVETLKKWYDSLDGYDQADVPDTCQTRSEIAELLGIEE